MAAIPGGLLKAAAGGEAGKEADDHDGNAELQAVVSREQVFNLLECE